MLRRYHKFQVGDDLTSAHSYIRKSYEKLDSNNPRFANRAWTDLLQGQPQTDILIEADGRLERGLSAAINLLGADQLLEDAQRHLVLVALLHHQRCESTRQGGLRTSMRPWTWPSPNFSSASP
jgi:hypothetical protein